MASRGWRGGLAKTTISLIHVLDAMGKDIILVETVGVGQSDVEISKVADSSILILSPGSGDEMQMMKAGIMEAADIFVVNKADKGGAENVALSIELMLEMRTYHLSEWKPSIVVTEGISGKGADELVEAIMKHKEFLVSSGEFEKRRKERAREELIVAVDSFVKQYCYEGISKDGHLEDLVNDIAARKIDPHTAAVEVIDRFSKQFRSA
jgi:LAO/AO transport system kinase